MARKKPTEDWSAEHRSAAADAPDLPGNARRSAKPSALLDIIVPLTVQEILEEQIGMKLV